MENKKFKYNRDGFARLVGFTADDLFELSAEEIDSVHKYVESDQDRAEFLQLARRFRERYSSRIFNARLAHLRSTDRRPPPESTSSIQAVNGNREVSKAVESMLQEKLRTATLPDKSSGAGSSIEDSKNGIVQNALVFSSKTLLSFHVLLFCLAMYPTTLAALKLMHEVLSNGESWINLVVWYGLAVGGGIIVFNNVFVFCRNISSSSANGCAIVIGSLSSAAILHFAISALPQ